MKQEHRKVVTIVMDGIGVRESSYGNAVKLAHTPVLDLLEQTALYRTLRAHGPAVGLPSEADMGNSEVGHNALGAGRVFDQGAKLVEKAINTGALFAGKSWQQLVARLKATGGALHFIGLLSDGNVHSHENHLYRLLEEAKKAGLPKVRLHPLLDGRDVPEKSAETYIERILAKIDALSSADFSLKIASGGGRMVVTMDRYEADWQIVKRGWDAQVRGQAEHNFGSISEAIAFFRRDQKLTDQYIPPFVIREDGEPVGRIVDGDAVVFFNFRGDRAIEVSRAFTEENFSAFERGSLPDVFYVGMMEYDGDLHIPPNYLVEPPAIDDTLSEYLVGCGLRQFACSETQKYGHVTYFWNGNRSGKIDDNLEEYLEINSDNIEFQYKPWMKCYEITQATIERMLAGTFDFIRINYPNGDMVGHTGSLEAAMIAVAGVDMMIGYLVEAARKTDTILMITADHGNCDEMFELKKGAKEEQGLEWLQRPISERPMPKTAHTLNPVPFYLYDPRGTGRFELSSVGSEGSIANIAATVIELLGLDAKDNYLPSLIKLRS